MHDDITDVPGIRVGHDTNQAAMTGCTVVVCDHQPTVGGVDVRGGAPGTRETDLLDPSCTVNEVHAVLLTGGSAFGLDAATGVMRALERAGVGYDAGVVRVPIVPAAVLFDLAVGSADIRPDAASGERATLAATADPVPLGSVGAGTGATVGKIGGPATIRKGGIGSASAQLPDGNIVGALVAVNALGNVMDAETAAQPAVYLQTETPFQGGAPLTNTTIAVIATTARLGKAQARKVAQMAHDGLARVIRPIHTPYDGDVVFALSVHTQETLPADTMELAEIGSVAADTLARAVLKAIRAAS
jgi:L-aminopeptidase/D-esterase-like protein